MPFERFFPHPFTTAGVHAHAPAQAGIYGISNAREWIYIGEADNIQEALVGHLQDLAASLMQRQPTGFVFEVCAGARRLARQDRLVIEYAPTCNGHS